MWCHSSCLPPCCNDSVELTSIHRSCKAVMVADVQRPQTAAYVSERLVFYRRRACTCHMHELRWARPISFFGRHSANRKQRAGPNGCVRADLHRFLALQHATYCPLTMSKSTSSLFLYCFDRIQRHMAMGCRALQDNLTYWKVMRSMQHLLLISIPPTKQFLWKPDDRISDGTQESFCNAVRRWPRIVDYYSRLNRWTRNGTANAIQTQDFLHCMV